MDPNEMPLASIPHVSEAFRIVEVMNTLDLPGFDNDLGEYGYDRKELKFCLHAMGVIEEHECFYDDSPTQSTDAQPCGDSSIDVVEKPLSTTERNTLLKLVIGMAIEGYKYDPQATRSTIPTEISGDLAKLDISVTDDTVRKWLKEAASTVLPGTTTKA